jgi:hypothetical protein
MDGKNERTFYPTMPLEQNLPLTASSCIILEVQRFFELF